MAITTPTKRTWSSRGFGSLGIGAMLVSAGLATKQGCWIDAIDIDDSTQMRIDKLDEMLGVFNERIQTLEDLAGVKSGAGCASFYNSRIEKLEALAGVNPNAIGNAQERIKALEIWFGVE